ncbi:MAG: hypothetical protein ACFE0I_08085 [Elainellaceae cyanobacterium]
MTIEVDIQESVGRLHQAIETRLAAYGAPLRWAITSIESADESAEPVRQKAYVEAVVVVDRDASVA